MEKKITVYNVTLDETVALFTTKAKANEAQALLAKFGLEAVVTPEKRTIQL